MGFVRLAFWEVTIVWYVHIYIYIYSLVRIYFVGFVEGEVEKSCLKRGRKLLKQRGHFVLALNFYWQYIYIYIVVKESEYDVIKKESN